MNIRLNYAEALTLDADLASFPETLTVQLTWDAAALTGQLFGLAWVCPGAAPTVWPAGRVTRETLAAHLARGGDLVVITGQGSTFTLPDGTQDGQLEVTHVSLIMSSPARRAATLHLWSTQDARLRVRLKQVVLGMLNALR